MKRQWLLSLAVFFTGSILNAAPTIKNVSGDLTHGEKTRITGVGFGPKKSAPPLIWDDMEWGQFHPAWSDTYDLKLNDGPTHQRHRHSKYNGFNNFTSTSTSGHFKAGNDVYPDWYVQYWFKLGPNWNWGSTGHDGPNAFLSNIKLFRMWNPGATNENFVVAINGWLDELEYVMENVKGAPGGKFLKGFKRKFHDGQWHHLQFEFGDNWGLDQKNGEFRVWVDGKLLVNQTNILMREDYPGYKRPFIIGFSEVWGPNKSAGETDRAPNNFYIDDVYVDNSWARIELGDNPIYANCTHREIQIPVQWSDKSIEFKANTGSFPNQARAYLFVVNDHGAMNTVGKPVTINDNPPQPTDTIQDIETPTPIKSTFRKPQ